MPNGRIKHIPESLLFSLSAVAQNIRKKVEEKNWQPVATKEWNLLQWIHYTVNCFFSLSKKEA